MKKNYINETIKEKEIEKILQPGISLIASPTGTGKSTFIIEELVKPLFENENHAFGDGEYNQFTGNSAALLNNRTAVTIKTIGDVHNLSKKIGVSSTSNIDVSSYQKISSKEAIDSIDKGKIIICDEAHYFIADAWNLTTPLIVEKLIEVSKTKPVIMFTATPQLIYKYLVEHRKLELNAFLDFRNELGFSDRMDFICTNKSLKEIIKDIPKDEKWLVFVEDMRSRKLIQKFCTELNDEGYEVEFYHSMWIQTKTGKFIGIKDDNMQTKILSLVTNKKFNTQGAIANKAIDNGIDMIDADLKHIILLNQYDHVQIQQMIGRKRFDINNPDDRLNVWLTTESKPVLNNTFDQLNNSINVCSLYKNYEYANFEKAKYASKVEFEMNEAEYTEEELNESALKAVFRMFLKKYQDEDMQAQIEKLKLTCNHLRDENYVGLLLHLKKYLEPLLIEHQEDVPDGEGSFKTITRQNIVKNYQRLVEELFELPSEIQWKNTHDDKKQELTNRLNQELIPYLQGLEGIKLFDNEKRDFESQISYYYGASKRSDRLASLKTINEYISGHGFIIESKRAVVNQKQRTVWVISNK